jgi:hypothetical protein
VTMCLFRSLGINLSGESGRDNLPKRYFTLISQAVLTVLRKRTYLVKSALPHRLYIQKANLVEY